MWGSCPGRVGSAKVLARGAHVGSSAGFGIPAPPPTRTATEPPTAGPRPPRRCPTARAPDQETVAGSALVVTISSPRLTTVSVLTCVHTLVHTYTCTTKPAAGPVLSSIQPSTVCHNLAAAQTLRTPSVSY